MIELKKIEVKTKTTEEIKELRNICPFLPLKQESEVYGVYEIDELKSIFCFSYIGFSMNVELYFGTKKEERKKGYIKKGLEMLLDHLKTRDDIKAVDINKYNSIAEHIAKNAGFREVDYTHYTKLNKTFNPAYKKLSQMIQNNEIDQEEILKFCFNNPRMLFHASRWLKIKNQIVVPLEDGICFK